MWRCIYYKSHKPKPIDSLISQILTIRIDAKSIVILFMFQASFHRAPLHFHLVEVFQTDRIFKRFNESASMFRSFASPNRL